MIAVTAAVAMGADPSQWTAVKSQLHAQADERAVRLSRGSTLALDAGDAVLAADLSVPDVAPVGGPAVEVPANGVLTFAVDVTDAGFEDKRPLCRLRRVGDHKQLTVAGPGDALDEVAFIDIQEIRNGAMNYIVLDAIGLYSIGSDTEEDHAGPTIAMGASPVDAVGRRVGGDELGAQSWADLR